jgi:hypothetical protein|tara:strand:+ start:121 stop:228 length:108 start_codon:yes stop_codon:yes gene_type:complete
MEENDSDVMASKVFYVILGGCILFMAGAYIFAFNA